MSMAAWEAKKLSLEVWRYLAEHPQIDNKGALPTALYAKIAGLLHNCPLCELFNVEDKVGFCVPVCSPCPLKNCFDESSLYYEYIKSKYKRNPEKSRKYYAQKIVNAIEAWDPDK